MRVLGKYYDDIIAVEVIEARAFTHHSWDRVIIRSKLNEYYIVPKDKSPLTDEQANMLVRDMATKGIIDLDAYDMELFWEDDVVVQVKNVEDPNGDPEPLMVRIAKASDEEDDDDFDEKDYEDDAGDSTPKISGEDLIRAAERLGIEGHVFRNENGEPDTYYSPEEQRLMYEEALKEKGYLSEEELAKQLGVDVEDIRKVCKHYGIKGVEF